MKPVIARAATQSTIGISACIAPTLRLRSAQ
jgi:hypothetical protein